MKEPVLNNPSSLDLLVDWFFERGDARVAAALRISFGLIFLFTLWDLYPALDLLMGHAGLYGSINREAFNPYHPFALLYQFDSPLQLRVWIWVSTVVTLGMVLGLCTRINTVLTYFCFMLYYKRDPFILFGTDTAYLFCFIWLIFLASDRRWSLDQYFRGLRNKKKPQEIELWPVKALQIQIALIYLYTGIAKAMTEPWLDGSGVYYALNIRLFVWPGALQIVSIKPLMVLLNYFSLFAELSFPFLVFRKSTRWIALGMVFFMHQGIDIFMRIRFFSLCMYAGLLSFIKPNEWEWLANKCSAIFLPSRRKTSRI